MSTSNDLSPLMLGFRLGDWIIEPRLGRLSRDGASLHVRPQLMDLAVFLAANQNRVVSKDQIFAAVWEGQFVAESALARCVAELRHLLGDAAKESTYIETIPKRGYRLIAPVTLVETEAPPPPPLGAQGPVQPPSLATAEAPEPDRPAEAPAAPPPLPPPAPPAAVEFVPAETNRLWAAAVPGGASSRRWLVISAAPLVALAAIALGMEWAASAFAPPSKERILLAGFASRTDDPVVDEMLGLALAVQLQRSPSLQVVTVAADTGAAAARENGGDAAARRRCREQSASALVSGSVVPFGARYALGLEAVACATGEVLVREYVEAQGKDDLLKALDLAASSLRRKLADSLSAIRRASAAPVRRWQQARNGPVRPALGR